uniref:EGF-like domain-containing protein n=1 Tax=Magallana gigas TaxID=29159 RepID=A0A8W8P2L6_MAGGI
MEVYGCPTPGYYGENCSLPCPQTCQGSNCNIVDGTCPGCNNGYRGPTCDEKCSDGTYGLECGYVCGNCSDADWCNHVYGSCPNGCDVGVFGDTCDRDCSMKCGNCLYLYGEQCHHVTGQCPRGCGDGFHGGLCDQGCPTPGHYGEDCSLQCPKNCQEGHCHIVDGNCLGCIPGYRGPKCNDGFTAYDSASSDLSTKNQSSTTIYVCVTIISLSVLLNVFFIIRQLKNRNVCRQQIKQEKADEQIRGLSKGLEKTTHFSKSILNQDEENVAYQELGELAKESRYDDLS